MSNKKISILLIGTGSLLNYGCEAIIQGSYVILKTVMPDCDIYVASDDLEYDSKVLPKDIKLVRYRKRFTPYRLYKGILRRFLHIGDGSAVRMDCNIGKKYDIVLSCGGDNFCEHPDKGLYSLLIDLMEIGNVAHRYSKKYILWGASVGPFSNDQNLLTVMKNLSKCDLITVREEISYKYLQENKLTDSKIKLVADPAFYLQPDDSIALQKEKGKIYIGLNINLLAITHAVIKEETETFISSLFAQLDNILQSNQNYVFVCIPHVVIGNEGPQNDIYFMNRYIEYSACKKQIQMLPLSIGAAKTKGYIQSLDLLIAARMHCCVAGISTATPTLFITYSNKGKGMSYYAYHHHNYEVEVTQMIHPEFNNLLKEMLAKKTEIKEYLNQQQDRFKEESMKSGLYLQQVLHTSI